MPLETHLLDESFACEVVGLRLWEPPNNQTIDELRALWAHHPVLVFRRQALSEDELADFSARFGPLGREASQQAARCEREPGVGSERAAHRHPRVEPEHGVPIQAHADA